MSITEDFKIPDFEVNGSPEIDCRELFTRLEAKSMDSDIQFSWQHVTGNQPGVDIYQSGLCFLGTGNKYELL